MSTQTVWNWLSGRQAKFLSAKKRVGNVSQRWLLAGENLEQRALLSAVCDLPSESPAEVTISTDAVVETTSVEPTAVGDLADSSCVTSTPLVASADEIERSEVGKKADRHSRAKQKFPNLTGTWQFPGIGVLATFTGKKKKLTVNFNNGVQQFSGVLKAQKKSKTTFAGNLDVPSGAGTVVAQTSISFPAGQSTPAVCNLQSIGPGISINTNGVRLQA